MMTPPLASDPPSPPTVATPPLPAQAAPTPPPRRTLSWPRALGATELLGAALMLTLACSDPSRGQRAALPGGPPAEGANADAAANAAPPPLRFVYALTERPAVGLHVTLMNEGGAALHVLPADAALPRPAGALALRVLDPVSGLLLYQGPAPAASPLRLPLPARVVGRVVGFGGAVQVHHGSGARLSVADYARRAQDALWVPAAEEDRAWGLRLPTIAERWAALAPRRDGGFETDWLPLLAPPQLAVVDGAGRLATLEVALPARLDAHARLDAGAIAPQPALTLELDRRGLSLTALPLLLQVSLEAARLPVGSEAAAALRLTLLHRLDPRAAAFAARRQPLDVALAGPTRVNGLPALAHLELLVTGPRPGLALRRSLTPPADGGPARLSLRTAELLGAARRVPLVGRVRFPDGRPAAGATVVYSSYPDRQETRSDATGAFRFAAVAAGRQAVLFVDAPAGGAPPFERTTVTARLEISAAQRRVEVELTAPAPLAGADLVRCPAGQASSATVPIPYKMRTCGTRITQSEQLAYCPVLAAYRSNGGVQEVSDVEVAELQVNPDGAEALAQLRVPAAGTYTFVLSYTPFLYAVETVEITSPDAHTVRFLPPDPWPSAVVVAVDEHGRPAPDLDVAFPNLSYAADPFDALTDRNGALEVDCFTLDPVPAFVASDAGCFEGPVRLTGRGANLVLGACDDS
jgi:hypothetical protein